MAEHDSSFIKVPVWVIQIVIAATFAVMGWTLKESFAELRDYKTETTKAVAEINQHLVATDIRVTLIEQRK